MEAWSPLGRGNVLDNPLLKSIAANHGKSVAQVVIRWVMQTGVLPLAKSVTPSRIKENIDVFDFELSQQEMFEIASLKADRIGSDPDTCDFLKIEKPTDHKSQSVLPILACKEAILIWNCLLKRNGLFL